ncbi:MAG: NUDIX hydrolase [Lachnospiraceae bacterium]|nr:NUDIX hydrolase [Lachnospiraceae bacterium]
MIKIEREKRELAYQGTILTIYRDTVRLPNGETEDWDTVHHNGAAAVIPVLSDGRILMVRQYRNALNRFMLELPAGALDSPDEPDEVCAARELEEETGYRSENLERLICVNTTVAFCDERIGVFVARDLIPSRQKLDAGESLDVLAYTMEELEGKIFSGEITDGKTIAGLMAYKVRYCS